MGTKERELLFQLRHKRVTGGVGVSRAAVPDHRKARAASGAVVSRLLLTR